MRTAALKNYDVVDELSEDSEVQELIAPYKEKLDEKMNEIMAINKADMFKAKPEGELNNFMCDAAITYSREVLKKEVDFAIANYGGMRIPQLPAGPVTLGKLYELMPFENRLLILEMSAEKVERLFQQITRYGGWPVSKEVNLKMDTITSSFDLLLSGEEIIAEKIYRVVIPDYIANGGDQCDFLIECKQEDLGVLFRDALIEYAQLISEKGEDLFFEKDGRISYDK